MCHVYGPTAGLGGINKDQMSSAGRRISTGMAHNQSVCKRAMRRQMNGLPTSGWQLFPHTVVTFGTTQLPSIVLQHQQLCQWSDLQYYLVPQWALLHLAKEMWPKVFAYFCVSVYINYVAACLSTSVAHKLIVLWLTTLSKNLSKWFFYPPWVALYQHNSFAACVLNVQWSICNVLKFCSLFRKCQVNMAKDLP